MKGPCGCSLRKEEQSSALWSLGLSIEIKYSQPSAVLLWFSRMLLMLFLQDDCNVWNWLLHSKLFLHPISIIRLKNHHIPSLNSPSASYFFFWALFVVQNRFGVIIIYLKIALASNFGILIENIFNGNPCITFIQGKMLGVMQSCTRSVCFRISFFTYLIGTV